MVQFHALVVLVLLLAVACSPLAPPDFTRSETHFALLDEQTPPLRLEDARTFVPLGRGGRLRLEGGPGDDRSFRFVEPLVSYETQAIPSDSSVRLQWALAAIRAPLAWEHARDASQVTVAVVDTGIALDHADLAESIWVNEGEEPENGLDDDANGYVDDVNGWDFVDDDPDPSPGSDAAARHGTHVAGIIGAGWDNARGIAGVAPHVRIMAIRALAGRRGSSDAVADAVDYACENGARIVNLSLGGRYSRLLDEALERAARRGVIVVAASGNAGAPRVDFPAASTLPNVVGVGATDRAQEVASFSNGGSGLDVLAPGVDILATLPSGYGWMSGTSMAAPHVSGAFALALASEGVHARSASDLLARLQSGPDVLPRLDLARLVSDAPSGDGRTLSSRRSRLTFTAPASMRRPPPQTLAIDADVPTPFTVSSTADWIHPGRCRVAPCRLSFSVQPSDLGAGAHAAEVSLVPSAPGRPLRLWIELLVGDLEDHALEVEVNGVVTRAEGAMDVGAGRPVEISAVRGGLMSAARWQLDGSPVQGSRLRGIFPRPGRHRLEATDGQGHHAVVDLDVGAEIMNAAPALDVPDRGG